MAKIDELTLEVGRIYAQAERDIIQRIANRLKKDKSLSIEQWEIRKLRELQTLRSGIEKQIVAKLDNFNDKELQKIIQELYNQGSKDAVADLRKVYNINEITTDFGKIDEATVANYTKALKDNLQGTHLRIVRQADDVYRQAVSRGVNTVLTGSGTRVEGSQRVLNEFANKGVTGFVDKSGRSWSLKTYAEMATRTTAARARIDGSLNRFQQNGEDLVVVSAHAESCPICDPWEGRILSISGRSEDYPSVAEAEADGLWHANCTHNATLWVEGLTTKPEPVDSTDNYQQRQQQRYMERQIRKWKRREAGAMTEDEARKAKNYRKKWQEKQKEFIEETGRYRKYEREQIKTAR